MVNDWVIIMLLVVYRQLSLQEGNMPQEIEMNIFHHTSMMMEEILA